jgi:hypothetical protein
MFFGNIAVPVADTEYVITLPEEFNSHWIFVSSAQANKIVTGYANSNSSIKIKANSPITIAYFLVFGY